MSWRDLDRLPPAETTSWEARRIGGRRIVGKAAVDAAVAKWNPLDPLVVSPAGSSRFLTVLHVDEYRNRVHEALRRKHVASIAVLLVLGVLLAASGLVADRASAVRAGTVALVVGAFVLADYYLVVRHIDALAERALFIVWIVRRGAMHTLIASVALLAIGGLQLYAEMRVGGREALLVAIGAVRGLAADEPWRIVVGPFLHGSVTHWLTNFAMLAVGSAIAGPLLSGARPAVLFVCGSTFGALASLAVEATAPSDVYVGVSAGIFALLGWCAGAALRCPASFPSRFAVTAGGFALLNVTLAWLAAPSSSTAGHVGGMLLGVLAGLFVPPACESANSHGRG